jgi:hypothetical protein
LPAIGFKQDGSTDALAGTFNVVPGTVARTVFMIASPDGDNPNVTNYGMIDLSAQAAPLLGTGYGITPEVAIRVSGNQVYNGALTTGTGSVLTVRAPANSTVGPSGNNQAFINGVALTTNPISVAATINSTGAATELGRIQMNDVNDYKGRLGEVIVYNRELNNAERVVVENYLSARFNAGGTTVSVVNKTLGANDFYAGDLSTNGNYDFDVIGVGNSGTGSLINAGAAGFGIETVAGAGAGQMGTGEYLFAGHNSTANAIVAFSNDPVVSGNRWARSWYLDKTGTLDATIAFDFEDAGLTLPTPGSTFHLLYSADGDFSAGWQILAQTNAISSGTVAFSLANANLLDGYFTLGLNISVPEPASLTLLLMALGGCVIRRRPKSVSVIAQIP